MIRGRIQEPKVRQADTGLKRDIQGKDAILIVWETNDYRKS